MPVVQIAPATRQGMKLLISLFGLSETGKTYSALKLAAGIEPDPNKRGLLDTEGGERGRAYVDAIPGGYLYGSLTAPFTPERYIEALEDFIAAGVTALVIDSASHAWYAEGGILDMVEKASEKNDMAKWAKPKRRLGKLTGKWLGCGLHIILCSRGKQPLIEGELGSNGKPKLIPGPVVPVQEKSLRFDMTIMAHMLGDGLFSVAKSEGGKCPGDLRPIFAAGTKMDEEMGRKLMAWIGGQDAMTAKQRSLLSAAFDAAALGERAGKAFFQKASPADRDFLRPHLDNLASIAAAADEEERRKRMGEVDEAEFEDDKAAPFGSGPALVSGIQRPDQAAAA